MDQETAMACLTNGGTFVFLNVVPGIEFGIDCYQCAAGDNFMGVKMIPPGVHLIYYATVSSDGIVGLRTSLFHYFEPKSFCVKKFDKQTESLTHANSDEIEALRNSLVGDLDRRLGPYPYQDQYRKWLNLSQHISPATIERISPLNEHRVFDCVASFKTKEFMPTNSARRKKLADEKLSKSTQSSTAPTTQEELERERRLPNTELRFVPLPESTLRNCSSPSAVTALQFDKSDLLHAYLNSHPDFSSSSLDEELGEIQFAFVSFRFGYVFDAFEHWKQLVILYATSRRAVSERPTFYKKWLNVLYFQLQEIPEDFFVDIVEQRNFLFEVLHAFFDTCNAVEADDVANEHTTESDVDTELRSKARKLRIFLENKFGWDFSYIPDDEQPVIVSDLEADV